MDHLLIFPRMSRVFAIIYNNMQKEPKVAAYEGGELRFLAAETTSREVVLALPLTRLIVRMLRVPADQDPVEFATPVLKSLSPFPDEPLAVSCEIVRETTADRIVMAAALPEGAADDIGEALDAAKLSVVKIDALALGALRGIWGDLGIAEGEVKRKLVILRSPDCLTLFVMDGDQPASVRAVVDEADLKRETMLSLLEAEDFNGPRELSETIERTVSVDDALVGIRDRASDPSTINAIPESWGEVLQETRFKAKLVRNLAVAVGVWLLAMGVLLGVPVVYGFMTDHMKDLCRQHKNQYLYVSDMKGKTELVRKYSDHSRGALEIMKAVSDRRPDGITLTSWDFNREDGVRIKGDADDKGSIYEFKDQLTAMGGEEGGEPVFQAVKLGSVNSQKDGMQRFDLECGFKAAEEQ